MILFLRINDSGDILLYELMVLVILFYELIILNLVPSALSAFQQLVGAKISQDIVRSV